MSLSVKDLQTWKSRIVSAQAYQQRHHARWRDSLDWLNLRYMERIFKGNETEWTQVHWVWNYYNTLIPTLYAKDPNVQVKAKRKLSVPFSETMAEVLPYLNEELDLKASVQAAIGDSVPYSTGYVEVGYEPTEEEIKAFNASGEDSRQIKTLQAKVTRMLSRAFREGEESPNSGPQLLPTIRQGSPYLKWIPAWRVFLCPGYHLLKEMPYVIIAEDIEKEDLLRNPRYKKAQVELLRPTRRVSTGGEMVKSQNPIFSTRGTGDIPLLRLWHIWDRRNLGYIVLADGSNEELLDWPWPVSTNEFLLKQLQFNRIPPSESDASTYGMDDITPIKPQLIEKSLGRTDMIKARRRAAPLIYMQKGANNEKEAQRLATAGIANVVLLDDISVTGIRGDNPIRIMPEVFQVDDRIDNDLNTVSGFTQLALSGQSKHDISASEANIAQGGMALRGVRKVDIIEEFIKDITRTLALVAWEKMDRDEIADILGKPVSEDMWPDITALTRTERMDKIARELDFRIEAHSTQPDQIRLVEQNMAIRNTNMIRAAFPNVTDEEKLLRYHMKKMGDKEFEFVLKPEGEASRLEAEQENQLLLQGVFQLAHKGDRHDIHILSHGQAAETAQAQGLDTSSLDRHTLMHNQLMTAELPKPGATPQQGDTSSPQQAVLPEVQRQGVEKFPDLVGESSNIFSNTGAERPAGL